MSGIVVSDLDDTLISAKVEDIAIIKHKDGKTERLSTDEFAKDKDKGKEGVEYDFSEFDDPKRIRDSIINGTPLLRNLNIIDNYLNKGYDFAFLTARGSEDIIKDVMSDFMKYKDESGHLNHLGDKFNKALSFACRDEKYCEILDGLKDFEKKAKILKIISDMYSEVVFLDDDLRNLTAAKNLHLPNLKIIRAKP